MTKFKPVSFHLQWSITERCNLNCKHCYRDPKLIKGELSTEGDLEILDKFVDQVDRWGLKKQDVRISYTGGEPFIKKGLFKLLKKSRENHDKFFYGLLSNGTFIDEKMVRKLNEYGVDYVQVSLEGMKENNDYIRGKGIFKKIIKAVKLLKKGGINTNFSMTVTQLNLKDVPEVVKLAKDIGILASFRRLVPIGEGKQLIDQMLTPGQLRGLWRYLMKVREKFWPYVSIGCEDGMLVQDIKNYRPGDCSAGYTSFTVLPTGDVYPCRRLPILAGNLTEESFEDVYYSEEMKKLRNINNVNDVCYQCPHFENCKGGAKCLSAAYFGDFTAPDPNCWRLFDQLPNSDLEWENNAGERKEVWDPDWLGGVRT